MSHHPALFAALGVAVLLLVINEIVGVAFGGKRLSPQEAVRLINDRDPVVLDVRTAADFKRGHILNAVNIPLAKLDERVKELGKMQDRPVVVYCALGGVSVQATDKLRKAGFKEVYPIRGGLNGWVSASLPVTTR